MKTLRGVATLAMTLLLGVEAYGQNHDILSQAGFGSSVAVADGDVLVGQPLNNQFSGRVYVYRKDAQTGRMTDVQVLEPTDGAPMNGFGATMASSGDLVAIVASWEDERSVYLFRRNTALKWTEEAQLKPNVESPEDEFGDFVAISGDRVFTTVSRGDSTSRVMLFERQGSTDEWVETESVELPASAASDISRPIVASGDVAFVGGPDVEGGAVFELRPAGDGWNVTRILQNAATEGGDDSAFGASLALDGDVLLVGAPGSGSGAGSVSAFVRGNDGEFGFSQTLTAFGDSTAPLFGSVVTAQGGSVLVGAHGSYGQAGAVYAFARTAAGTYEPRSSIRPNVGNEAGFGTALAMGDAVAVAGAAADLYEYGSAFVYRYDGSERSWIEADHLTPVLAGRLRSVTGGKVRCLDGNADGFDCRNVDMMSFLSNEDLDLAWGIQTSDVWGWTDPESGGEYAIVCTMDGTTFVDISDPTNPVVLGVLPMTPGSWASWWRDAKTYKNYVYVVADNVGRHGLQIFDLTRLRNVENPPVKFEPTAVYRGFDSAHNVVINEQTGFAYVVGASGGGNTCGGGPHMLDLSEPAAPKFVGCFSHEGTGENRTGYTHDAECVVYHGPDERYTGREICVAENETVLSIADFTDKTNVVPIAVGRYPDASYVHQGWLTEDQRYLFQNDEGDEINGLTDGTRTLVWDLSKLDDPAVVDEYISANKATDHNNYVKGSYLYQSNYVAGLRVFDVSNPVAMREAGYFDTVPWGEDRPGYGGSWSNYPFFESGVIVVTSGEEGVFFLKRSEVAP